jgi:hypothetical protein
LTLRYVHANRRKILRNEKDVRFTWVLSFRNER